MARIGTQYAGITVDLPIGYSISGNVTGAGGGGGNIIEEPFSEGTGGNAWASFTGSATGFTGVSDADSVAIVGQDLTAEASLQNNKITFTVDSLTDGGIIVVDIISASDLSGSGTVKSNPTKTNKGNKTSSKLKIVSTGDYEVYYDIESPDGSEELYLRYTILGDAISVTVSDVSLIPQGDYDLALDRIVHWDWSEATGTGDRVDRVSSRALRPSASLTRTTSPVGYALDFAGWSGNTFYLRNIADTGIEDKFDLGWDFTRHTVAMLVKRNGTPSGTEVILADQDVTSNSYRAPLIYCNNTGNIVYLYTNASGSAGKTITSTTNICDNAWHLVVFTWDGGNELRCFIDGVEDATPININGSGANVQYRSSDVFNVGSYYVSGASPFTGQLGDLIIWERVLSEGAIAALANGGSFLSAAAIESTAKTYESIVWTNDGGGLITYGSIGQPDNRLVRWQESYFDQGHWCRDSRGPWGLDAIPANLLALRYDVKPYINNKNIRVSFDVTKTGSTASSNRFFISDTGQSAAEENNIIGTARGTYSNPVGGTISGSNFYWTTPGPKQVDIAITASFTYLYLCMAVQSNVEFSFDNFVVEEIV